MGGAVMGMSNYVLDEEEAAFDALIGSIADYLDLLAGKQPERTARRALQVAAANVRAGLFISTTGAAEGNASAVVDQ